MTHKHNAQGKVDRSKSTLSLPKLSRPSIEDITLDKDKMQARLKELSISTLRKAKLHYPSFTQRRHSRQVEEELARLAPSAHNYPEHHDSSSDSVKILKDFLKDDQEEQKQKQAELMLLKRLPKGAALGPSKQRFTHERLVGEQAIKVFYDRYKHINKVHDKEMFAGQQNPITFVLSMLDMYNLPPKRMEIIKLRGNQAILDLRNCGLGRGVGARIISQLVSHLDNFQSIDLSYNELGQDSVELLLPGLKVMQSVNLSHNKIGKTGCQLLSNLFKNECNIMELELESNNLTDVVGAIVVDNLAQHNKLRLLNLSKNLLSNNLAFRMRKYLAEDSSLEELYLHWNELTDKGAKYLFDSLTGNSTLKVLDVSWNALTGRQATSSICQFFKDNKTLLHLDLSFCDFNNEESKRLSEALELNNTIYGIHYEGNMGYINYRGGLVCQPGQIVEYPIPIKRGILRRIRGVQLCAQRNEFKSSHKQDVCWICHGWQQVYFKVARPPGYNGECYLYLEFQNLIPNKMDAEKTYFDITKMCPTQNILFYFGMSQNKEVASTFHPMAAVQISKKPGLAVNTIKVNSTEQLFEDDFTIHCHCLPRSEVHVLKEFKQQTRKVQVTKKRTTIKKDVVKKRKVLIEEKAEYSPRKLTQTSPEDNVLNRHPRCDNEFYRQCLEFDIASSKLFKLINKPEDQKRFKEYMLENYQVFKTVYYFLCNNNVSLTGMYSASEFNIQQFIAEQKYESKRVTLAKIMLKLYACLMGGEEKTKDKAAEKPDKLVNRPQFMEFLVRLAQQKWCVFVPPKKEKQKPEDDEKKPKKESKTQSPPKIEKQKQKEKDEQEQPQDEEKAKKITLPMALMPAIERLVRTLVKYANRVNPDYWRQKKYLTPDCEVVFKGYESYLQTLYERYSGSRAKLKKGPKLMHIDEFKDMFINADLKKSREGLNECQDCFLDAKAMQFEEGLKPPTLDFLEFVEAFARYADRLSMPPVRSQRQPLWQKQDLRKKIPLFLKFESLVIFMYRRTPELQNKNLSRIIQTGMFAEQSDALFEIYRANEGEMSKTTNSKFLRTGFKLNTLYSLEDITLASLVSYLEDKYRDRVVIREQQIEEVEEVEQTVEAE